MSGNKYFYSVEVQLALAKSGSQTLITVALYCGGYSGYFTYVRYSCRAPQTSKNVSTQVIENHYDIPFLGSIKHMEGKQQNIY